MRLVIGGDHAGFLLKGPVVDTLREWGHTVDDVGTHSSEPVDFPDIARKLCAEVTDGRAERGIMVCGTGGGAAIAANKCLSAQLSTSEEFRRRVAKLAELEQHS